ncbi:TolC family protein [Curvibacter sp. PAE-UM]|uniref:TolC family protein n=1 Tax=Curvibacter sp. PAE-UM TaxID=1714344 RepID=UPI001F0A7456|nr:TolC family protein [Curvibacter sp. PAE-UM]
MKAATEAAWLRSVQAREAGAQQRGAEAARSAAGSLWARSPAVELGHRGDVGREASGRRESEAGLSWPLWLPGQQTARQNAADAQGQLAQAQARVLRLRLAGELREQAWGLQLLQAGLQQAEAEAKTLQELETDVERRVRVGDLARADAMIARAELLAASAQRTEAQQRLAEGRARWQVLTGQALDPAPAEPPAPETATLDETHPELALAVHRLAWSRSQLELVQHSRREAPEVAVSYRQEQGGGASTQDSVGVKLRLPFGTQDRNLPLEAAARGELEVAETSEQRLREQLGASLAAARLALRSAQERLEAEGERAALLQERAGLLRRAFAAGELALPELLRALSAASQAQAAWARQQAALGLARARYQQALGWLP